MLASVGPFLAMSYFEQIATIERRLDSSGAEQLTGKEPVGGTTSSNSSEALDRSPNVKPTDPMALVASRKLAT